MASPLRDLQRLARGLSLVAQEALSGSPALKAAKSGDFAALISSSLKSAVVSATDLAGLTKGKVREYYPPIPKETVVFFADDSAASAAPAEPRRPEVAGVAAEPETRFAPKEIRADGDGLDVLRENSDACAVELEGRVGEIDSNAGESVDKILIPEEESFRERSSGELGQVGGKLDGDGGGNVASLKKRKPRERRVPSTPFTRALGFAGLGAGLAWGTLQESAKRLVYGTPPSSKNESAYSPFLSEQNAERLALALCRMRGAALKLGQMLSIQDESLIPAPILSALEIVRQGADVMPRSQLNEVLSAELGPDWTSKLMSFDYEPMAAASIGQVHKAVMRDGLEVAMKIQYPGVADSIESDLENVRRLLDYTNLIPKGLFLDRAMKVANEELSRECDYNLEASNQKRFRELLADAEGFYVPMVIDEISSRRVLTTELVAGVPIDKVATLSKETRDYVGKKLLQLTLQELFVFRFMQTDPNWSNFLYDEDSNMINLIDFGAARDYPQPFVDNYLRMVLACANCDRETVIEMSQRLGFLTGMESDVMLDAHAQAAFIVGMPFATSGGYDFRKSNITHSMSTLGATMLKHRLTPPPDEAYSLHRKLSGAFLACIKLGAVVPCRELLLQVYENYQFSNDGVEVLASPTG